MFSQKRHNFLHAQTLKHHGRRKALRGVTLAFATLAVIVGAVALIALPLLYLGKNVYASAEEGRRNLESAQQAATMAQFGQAQAYAGMAEANFTTARAQMNGLLFLRALPWVGADIDATEQLLSSGTTASAALTDLLGVAGRLTAALEHSEGLEAAMSGSLPDAAKLFKELTPDQKRQVLASFKESAPEMRTALGNIDESLAALDAVRQDEVSAKFVEVIRPLHAKLEQLRTGLQLLLPIAERAPSLLGYPDQRRYLFFFQNNTELRPTGGFLGVYGLVLVKDADLVQMVTDDIYSLDGPAEPSDRPAPPAPIAKYIGINKWFLRDANWSPDFVVSASQMANFYEQEYAYARKTPPPVVDGVIAIDTEVARDVLRITGPMTVQGKTFDADNVVDALEFAVEKGFVAEGIAVENRKQIIAELVRAVIDKLESMPLAQLIESLEVARRNLDEGHVLLAMRDPELEAAILEKDWGGKLKPVLGDYLHVVDANLASLKSDPAVQRSIKYSVAPQADGSYVGTTSITYAHRGRFDWKTTRYRTYTRVYVPGGTELLGVEGAMENDKIKDPARRPGTATVTDELQRRSFGAFISIEPGETRTLTFRYKLSPTVLADIKAGEYRLDVEKQAGTIAHGLTLDLDFGKKLKTAVPAEAQPEWGDGKYRLNTDLRLDKTVEVSF